METWGKVIILADVRKKRIASASGRPNVFDIRSGAGQRPNCSVHPFATAKPAVPPKPA